jgi:biopolymer transport protein ExbD
VKLGRRHEEAPDITLTPLIDVVFLLLIFFMVSTSFSRHAEIELELPAASTEKTEERPEVIEVAIDVTGRYYVDGRQLVNTQMGTLKQAIRNAAGARKSPPLVISADANTPLQAVVTAMDAARQLGITHISFATSQAEEGGG